MITDGKAKGVYAITDPEDVMIELHSMLSKEQDEFKKNMLRRVIEDHKVKPLCLIPENAESFDWNENIHGQFFTE